MATKNHKPDRRRIKTHYSYSIPEVAGALDVCTNTVRAWLKAGLHHIRPRAEILILGGDLKDFLAKREKDRKRPSPPGAMYCFRCNASKIPPPELVEIADVTTALRLRGMCPSCGALMHRTVSFKSAETAGFGSQISSLRDHLSDSPRPSLN